MIASAPTADAAPIQSPVVNLAIPTTTAGIYINVVTGASGTGTTAGWDINPWSSSGLGLYSPASLPGGAYRQNGISVANAVLAIGTEIGPSSPYGGHLSTNPWTLNAVNYFGFRFNHEGTGQIHYGWASIVIGAAITTRSIGEIWYESTPGVSIRVGDPVASEVPEPSTSAMLAVGALGLLALRRRRQVK